MTLSKFCFFGVICAAAMTTGCSGSSDDKPAPRGDPLAQYQWHLTNTGQVAFSGLGGTPGMDLNVEPVFQAGGTGQGVNVMVLDDGLEVRHEDLAANINKSMLHNFDPAAADPSDPTPTNPDNGHGTAIAGVIAAVANNGTGGRGVAPGAGLGGAAFLGVDADSSAIKQLDAFGGAPFSQNTDIFNGSFGASPTAPMTFDPAESIDAVVLKLLQRLRGGKGAIFVQAAGNEYQANDKDVEICADSRAAGVSCSNGNLDPGRTMPQAIVVGAVNAFGVHASYSTAGSNLLVSAPGGEFGGSTGPAIVTTDLMGCNLGSSRRGLLTASRNAFDDPDSDEGKAVNPACNYTSRFTGTSAATPMVSGVAALMLQANPALTWRDVRFILMKTARRVDAQSTAAQIPLESGELYTPQPVWTRNAAGLWFDNRYGFGLVDAAQAVGMARSYTAYLKGPMRDIGGELVYEAKDGEGVAVPVGSAAGVDIPLESKLPGGSKIETTQLMVSLSNAAMRDVAIELISPAGTRSVLMNAYNVLSKESADVRQFVMASNAFNEESPNGAWTVRVIDTNARRGTTQAQVTRAMLVVSGR